MRTQIASRIGSVVLAVATMIGQPAARAQGSDTVAVANIPFDFQLGSQMFKAGKYSVAVDNRYIIRLQGDRQSGLLLVRWNNTNKPSATGRLVFEHCGSHYFLRQLHLKDSADFVTAAESKEEKRAQMEQLALNRPVAPGGGSATEVPVLTASR
ncbi:MAG TPA: hypothetical protein VGM11_14565 [Acidobacteriaceae bacterium]|jgi:hypothetical protein